MQKLSIPGHSRTLIGILLIILTFSLTGLVNVTEAQTMQNDKEALSSRQQGIVTIAAFTAKGDIPNLTAALHEGLDNGLTVNEIKEVLVQMYAYAGFPRSLNGINAFMAVMDDRRQKGIQDEAGPEARVMPQDLDRDEYGKNVRLQLVNRTEEVPPAGYQVFTPIIDTFLKEHLFADIFYRDNLDYLSREIATVSALAGLGNVESQLQSHMNIAMNVGLTEAQMQNLLQVINTRVGKTEGDAAAAVFVRVLDGRP